MEFHFGKYNGETVEYVWSIDKGYIRWLMVQDWFLDEHEELVEEIRSLDGWEEELLD